MRLQGGYTAHETGIGTMPGAGTDKTKNWVREPGPVVVLVETQLGDNIGSAARAMANFGLSRLRLVKPREPWPNARAKVMASGADRLLDEAELFDTLEAAIADCTLVLATTARAHDQAKPVVDAPEAMRMAQPRVAAGENVAIVFGRERYGLENQEVALADAILTLPVNPAFASLNIAQAVVVVAYEWFKLATSGALPFGMPEKSEPASKEQVINFFKALEHELEKAEFFRPPDKRDTMQINLRNIFTRMNPTRQDIRTLHGVLTAISEGKKGPAQGGILGGEEAVMFRNLLAERGDPRPEGESGAVRGLARFLRRNPTDAERSFWQALTRDRRFAGRGFKRHEPVGRHIPDIVSFPLRLIIELVPADENDTARAGRAERRAWMEERDYRVLDIPVADIEKDLTAALNRLEAEIERATP